MTRNESSGGYTISNSPSIRWENKDDKSVYHGSSAATTPFGSPRLDNDSDDSGFAKPIGAPTSTPRLPRPQGNSLSKPTTAGLSDRSTPAPFKPGTRFFLAWISLCILVVMAALDATSLSVALAQIASALKGSAMQAFWSGTSFLLTSTVFQPIIGSLSGIFGRKNLIVISLVFFLVGSIVAALAKEGDGMATMLVGRSLQGIGGGGIIVLSEILPTDLVPLRHRGNYVSAIGAMWAIGSVTGPIIGGSFAQHQNWRWIFWLNLPFIGIGGVMIVIFLNLSHLSDSLKTKLKRIDYVGSITFVGSATGFLIPLTWGGVMYPWTSWRTLVPLLISVAGFVFFIIWEAKFAVEPLIPLRVFRGRTVALTYMCTFLHGLILWCLLYYGPLYYEAVKLYSPIIAGVSLFPATFTIAPATVIVGIIVGKTGKYIWSLWAGWILAVLGFGLQHLLTPTTPIVGWIFIFIVTGLGTGLLFPGLIFSIQAATAENDVAPAIIVFTFLRTFGQAVGVALGGVVFQNDMRRQISSHPSIAKFASEWSKDASALVQIIHHMPDGQAKIDLRQSYNDALRTVWIVCCAFAAAGLIASMGIKAYTLDRELGSNQRFVENVVSDNGHDNGSEDGEKSNSKPLVL